MKATILLADADVSARQALTTFLENEGFAMLQANRDADLLDLLASNPIGLAVLDTNLDVLRGWETLARVATLNPLVPAIVTTSDWGQETRAVEAGVDALLEKPIDFGVLLRIIQELLAQPLAMRLRRVGSVEAFWRYVPRSNEAFLRELQERYTTPLATPELDRALERCVPAHVRRQLGDEPRLR